MNADLRVEQMDEALERVREILGSESESGLSKRMIEDALWEAYFDIDKTVDWLMRESYRRRPCIVY